MGREFEDLTGRKFGKLVVIEKVSNMKRHHGVSWKCKCDCGNEKIIGNCILMSGRIKSCGCLYRQKFGKDAVKYKKYGVRIRNIRLGMIDRCYHEYDHDYYKYGERGIRICDEWLDKEYGLHNFYNWSIANGYRDDLSIDRIDVNGNYCPENCRWVTALEQGRNKRNNLILEHNGESHTLSEWSKITEISRDTISKRLKAGWSIEDSLTKDVRKRKYSQKMKLKEVKHENP